MEAIRDHEDGYGVYADEVYLPPQKRCSTFFKRMIKRDEEGEKLVSPSKVYI